MKQLADYIKVYDGALSSEECTLLCDYYDDNEDEAKMGQVWTETGSDVKTHLKHVKQIPILMLSPEDGIIAAAVQKYLTKYATEFTCYPSGASNDKGYAIKKYDVEHDFYNWHVDASNALLKHRTLAMLIYLNDVDAGGETEFKNLDVSIQPKTGRMVLFPTSWQYPHRGCTPISNPKYVVTGFIGFETT